MDSGKKLAVGMIGVLLPALVGMAVWMYGSEKETGGEGLATEANRLTELGSCTVKVQMSGMNGSGVIWRILPDKIVIVTAAHVVGSETKGDIVLADGVARGGSVLYVSGNFDVAFMEVSMGAEDSGQCREAGYDREFFDTMQNGDVLYAVGYTGEAVQIEQGIMKDVWIYMEDFASYMTWGAMAGAQAGMSGGGVYDEDNRLVGILCGAAEEGEIAILPLSVLLSEASLLEG